MPKQKDLVRAKVEKNDEYYTRYEDIEKEVLGGGYDLKQFEDKVILCNCDDPFESSFTRFFLVNFKYLKIKRLICTCYKGSPIAIGGLFKRITPQNNGYVLDVNGLDLPEEGLTQDKILDYIKKNNLVRNLKGDGDFRSEECLAYLKEADIIITNPPFSLFKEFIQLLLNNKKDFLILGNFLALTYPGIFPAIQQNKLAITRGGACYYDITDEYKEILLKTSHDGGRYKIINDKVFGRADGRWYTTLYFEKRYENLVLYKTYKGNENSYPKYDNYDAININKTSDIPKDYEGIMGVPITFIPYYNPKQFKIVSPNNAESLFVNNKKVFARVFIQRIAKEE